VKKRGEEFEFFDTAGQVRAKRMGRRAVRERGRIRT
jgi:hypothetical protein